MINDHLDLPSVLQQAEALTVPLDHGGQLDQRHRVQTAWPQSVEPDPEQAVERKQSCPAPAADNEERAACHEGRGSPFQNGPNTESAGNSETIERTSLSMPATLRRPVP